MPILKVKPTSNARRGMSYLITGTDKVRPEKTLTLGFKRSSGRDQAGRLVVEHKGGGAKRKYRIIDFSMTSYLGLTGTVKSIEYDPNRSANIALVAYDIVDPETKKVNSVSKIYIVAPEGLKKGDSVVCDEKTPNRVGNRMKMRNIPVSTQIYNIEFVQGHGGQLCRSAGSFATLLGIDGDYALVRLTSGEVRKVGAENYASLGIVSNIDHSKVVIGTAGRNRHLGKRPHVLGKSKNPVDHPHGGGEGHTSIGMKYPKTPWGAPALGHTTRKKKKRGSKLIMSKRTK